MTAYLAAFVDLFSKRIVGWSMSHRMPASLVTDALAMAIRNRKPGVGLIVHFDQGGQYASDSYKKLLNDNKHVGSMSRKGNCWDNATSKSFFHTLKTKLVHHEDYQTGKETWRSIFKYIVCFITGKENTPAATIWHLKCMSNQ